MSDEIPIENVGVALYLRFREDMKKIMAMSPEEYKDYQDQQELEGRQRAARNEYERCLRKVEESESNIRKARRHMKEVGLETEI